MISHTLKPGYDIGEDHAALRFAAGEDDDAEQNQAEAEQDGLSHE